MDNFSFKYLLNALFFSIIKYDIIMKELEYLKYFIIIINYIFTINFGIFFPNFKILIQFLFN